MFSHVMIGSNDIERSKKFYDALLPQSGRSPADETTRAVSFTRIKARRSW
jgi:catechol 2,3-dioxygenase-like lactoylglutathione lyase family enzyme